MISQIKASSNSVMEKLELGEVGPGQFGNDTCQANNSVASFSKIVELSGKYHEMYIKETQIQLILLKGSCHQYDIKIILNNTG